MKKIMMVLVLIAILLSSCNTKNERKIVGTWIDRENRIWIFSTDGKLKYFNRPNDIMEYQYDVTETKLTFEITYTQYIVIYNEVQTYDISISSDGKTIILTNGKDFPTWSVAGPGWGENRLIRQPAPAKNAFTGTWSGYDPGGEKVRFVIEGSIWVMDNPDEPDSGMAFTATYNGNTADIQADMQLYNLPLSIRGTATVSGNSLTVTLGKGESFTLRK